MRPEDKLQKEVVKLLDMSGLLFTATANGVFLQGDAKQRAIRGKRMKEHGVKNGVPDLLIFDDMYIRDGKAVGGPNIIGSEWFSGLAIELKCGENKPTPDQLDWHRLLYSRHWKVEVCYTMDEVLKVLRACYPHKFK